MTKNIFDITEYGAVPNEDIDCTKSIQAALDAAMEVKGTVVVPPGIYLTGRLMLYPSVTLCGYPGWGYRETGGSVLKLNDDTAKCLLDLSGAFGSRVKGLQLLGNYIKGERVHGIYVNWEDYESRMSDNPEREDNALMEKTQIGFREDSITVEDCQVKNFSGDAVHLNNIWGFTLRNNQFIANKGNAVYVKGWDGWITDCIMHTNHGAGVYSDSVIASVTMTGNRIEWNRNGGLNLLNASGINITGNFFDRSYGPAVELVGKGSLCNNITLTGNIFNRSGKQRDSFKSNAYHNSHIYLENCRNIVATGNAFNIGKDDRGMGKPSPDYGIVCKSIDSCIIENNALNNSALRNSIIYLK